LQGRDWTTHSNARSGVDSFSTEIIHGYQWHLLLILLSWLCTRTGPVDKVPFSREEQIRSVIEVHSCLNRLTCRNCHSGSVGIGGTMRPKVLVEIFRALMHPVGEGGSVFDFGCAFGHVILSAMKTQCFSSGYGCELPDNFAQRGVFVAARTELGLDLQRTNGPSEWISSDVLDLIVPGYLRHTITAVFSFWNGFGIPAQRRVLELCRVTFINVRAVAVYWVKGWTVRKGIVVAAMHLTVLTCFRITSNSDCLFSN
jgi:hypothetical protein